MGQGVLDAVADGLLPGEMVDELVLLAVVWVDPAAHDETAVRLANREAMRGSIADAVADSHATSCVDPGDARDGPQRVLRR